MDDSLDSNASTHPSAHCPVLKAIVQEAEAGQLWEVLLFTSKISSDLRHTGQHLPFVPRETVDVRSLRRYLEENSACAPPFLV